MRARRAISRLVASTLRRAAAHIDAATHRLLVLIREFDRAGGWAHQGALSCAHWLSWRIGLGLGPAREKVRVAHKLADLPLLDEAFRRGELSYSKLRAMTRVATASNEGEMVELARHSTAAQLERICRFYCQARSQAGQDARVCEDERHWVVSRPTEDGFSAAVRENEVVFFDPGGHEIPPVVNRPPLPDGAFDRLREQIEHRGIHISSESNAPGWDGEPVDYDACVGAIGGFDPA